MWPEPLEPGTAFASSRKRPPTTYDFPWRGRIRHACMSEFELTELDYESPRESANVVNVERPTGESRKAADNPADRESDAERI